MEYQQSLQASPVVCEHMYRETDNITEVSLQKHSHWLQKQALHPSCVTLLMMSLHISTFSSLLM